MGGDFLEINNTWMFLNCVVMVLSGVITFSSMLCLPFAIIDSEYNKNDKEANDCCGLLIISFIVCILSMVLLCVGMYKLDKAKWRVSETPCATEQIVSLNDNNLTSGRFYMRRGYIEESLYYQYMVKISDSGMVPNKIPAQKSTIYYDNENPRVEWYKAEKHWLYFRNTEVRFNVYVPNGSVTESYNVDLK